MSEDTFVVPDLANGWIVGAVSVGEDYCRIYLYPPDDSTEAQKAISGTSVEEARKNDIEFAENTDPDVFIAEFWESMGSF